MNLSRGSCVLCTNNTKIIVPPQAEDITYQLKNIFADLIDYEKFEEVNSSLKICPVCLSDLLTLAGFKKNIKEGLSEDDDNCALCYKDEHLVYITEWVQFDKMLENVTIEKRRSRCSVCLSCFRCLGVLERTKTNLLKKYPDLQRSNFAKDGKIKKSPIKGKQNRRQLEVSSDEEPEYISDGTIKNVDNLKAALEHLKPLRNTRFDINRFKEDKKLLKQIAFVKLSISDLSTREYKNKEGKSDRSKRSMSLSDSDSERYFPSPKQSSFKIRLKLNSGKSKSKRVSRGKVTKPKIHKNKSFSEHKKELIVKIIKMNLDEANDFDQNYEEVTEIRTPTKASLKMMPQEPVTSSKKRKSVTFADVLDTEITDSLDHKDNVDATPLKSLLKKNVSSISNPFKIGSGNVSDEPGSEKTKSLGQEELDSDLDEDSNVKGYVEEILKNRDDIFDSLMSSKNTDVFQKNKKSSSIDTNTTDSDEEVISELNCQNKETNESNQGDKGNSSEGKKRKRDIIMEVSSNDSENEGKAESINRISNELEKQEDHGQKSADKEIKSVTQSREGNDIEILLQSKLDSNNDSDVNDQEISDTEHSGPHKNDKKINAHSEKSDTKTNNQKHKKRRLNSYELEKTTSQRGNKVLPENKEQENKIFRTRNGETERSDDNHCDSDDAETQISDKSEKDSSLEESIDKDVDNQISERTCEDEDKTEDVSENESNQNDDKQSLDTQSNFESNKSSNFSDSNNFKSKSEKKSKSIIENQGEVEDASNINTDEDCEEPETTREKVSEANNTDSETDINGSETKNEHMPVRKRPEQQKDGTLDTKIDEIIAKYTNPSIPNLSNDNVSDCQNVGVGGEDKESGSEEGDVAVSIKNDKDIGLEQNAERFDENVKNNSDITINSDVSKETGGPSKDLDFDDILDNVVDSC